MMSNSSEKEQHSPLQPIDPDYCNHVGDSAYAVRTYMLTPYLSPATPAERRYNVAHRATRNVVERTFGLLKSRFRCIHRSGGALQYSPETTCKMVATCAILHKIATTRAFQWNSRSQTQMRMMIPYHPLYQQTGPVQQKAGKDVLTSRATIFDVLHLQHGSFKAAKD
ncbi:putative nuclease HARBI1 [Pleurodeles waltl]|uniref:putative nuclease HARBI1 n=1 Tax=Pleurodeles waltl TaxID=8319 RepID=UPI003709B656